MTTKDEARPFRVLQLTDPHLMANADGELLGVNTRESLSAVIDEVLKVHGQPDLILATGDLAQDGSEEAYRVFGESLRVFACGSAWLAGNHDSAEALRSVAAEYQADRRTIVEGGWQCILLDSSVPGKVYGELSQAELDFLEAALAEHPDLPTMVTLHHHPVNIGSDWMEQIGLRNREAFWEVVDRYPQVKMVLWGHIHQEHALDRNGVSLLATPSTCIQFTSGSSRFSVEPLSPGYRWFELMASGDFKTEVRRAEDFEFELDQNSSGY
ncbi:3',5'-cyclic-AMP phosphodiesterase [Marinobacter sp. M216]|uniref:3',5'-cyclic-AMP phosphodiesterase n=1 Tax=Marinobacter albus TaxID=3030833 RepID=A0ABT7HGQ9_9GAMM|nr:MULTISPECIES: 3',5'-cyclic-AMP phosphodiesterase [unclassified Marinobacter]MBW7473036.1 3',5'-cyclic-AMP phosphodiesterase [Marinobacter sp. F4218]MDK9559571.1 3',5'-cyclic-AMP phosphodiesterase [Marinobacter sp. M216]